MVWNFLCPAHMMKKQKTFFTMYKPGFEVKYNYTFFCYNFGNSLPLFFKSRYCFMNYAKAFEISFISFDKRYESESKILPNLNILRLLCIEIVGLFDIAQECCVG